jgi:hypothetical protein
MTIIVGNPVRPSDAVLTAGRDHVKRVMNTLRARPDLGEKSPAGMHHKRRRAK